MKKFLVLLFVPLLLSVAFAANFTMSPTVKLDIQVQILSLANRLQITPTQAASISNSMREFKSAVNSLEERQVRALTSLRDALLSKDNDKISKSKEAFRPLEKEYLKAIEDFKNSIASVITLKQAIDAKKVVSYFLKQEGGPLTDMFKKLAVNERKQMNPHAKFNPNRKALQNQVEKPSQMPEAKRPAFSRGKTLENPNLLLRKAEFLHFIVNSNIYDLIIKTLDSIHTTANVATK